MSYKKTRARLQSRLSMVLSTLMIAAAIYFSVSLIRSARADTSPQTLPFSQNWTNTGQITVSNDWSGVLGIIGYRGDALTGATAVDPQTVLVDGSGTPVNVTANQTNPNTNTTGGIAEFDTLANPVVAFQGSATARAPHIVITLNTTGQTNINVAYNLRDVDGAADNAVQPVALQYRVGNSGNYTNISAGFVPDASTGPTLATLVTPVSVTLPAACNNQPVVQVRIITTDAVGSDEWIGIDDISITGTGSDAAPTVSNTTPGNSATNVATNADITVAFSEPVNVTGSWFSINCTSSGAHTATESGGPTTFTLNPNSDFTYGDVCTVTINHLLVSDQDASDPPDNMTADYVFSFTVGPTLSINDLTQVEGNAGTTQFIFTVSLSAPAPVGGVTFNIDTAEGTATLADNDFVAVHTTGIIPEGFSSANVTVNANGDATTEPNETFFVNISSVTGAAVIDAQGQGTIFNDDGVGSTGVVISQVYGGGGNSGSTYKNDFIELYNRGSSPVDLTGWSVQYAGAANPFLPETTPSPGTPLTTNLSGTIQPGHYYLIKEAAGAGGTTDLPTADLTGGILMGSGSGKIALVNTTTVLSGNCPASASIVDFVGYGTADCSETSATGALSNTTAALRKQNGCQDTNSNSLDFNVGGPLPRNSSITNSCGSAGDLSGFGGANPSDREPGGSTLLTVVVTPATGPTSTGITVSGNLTSIGGSATQTFYDDGTNGDVTIGDNVFSFFATVPANATTGAKSIPFSVADAQTRTASGTITVSVISPTCGVERWSVKVGTDGDAGLVDLTKATPITLATMRGWPTPGVIPLTTRLAPYETTAWVVNGTLINYKQEDDVDYHLVIQDGAGTTVITEIPCACCAVGSPFQARMEVARQTFDARLTAQPFFQNPNIPVRITGVGFFDFIHGQTGVAPNGIEIHTILDIAFPTTQSAPTSAGSNVNTQAGDVKINFGSVSSPGTTTATPIDPSAAGPPLAGYSLVGPAFDISTTAASTGPYGVCISVPYITDPAFFSTIKLLHKEGATLVDRTTGQSFLAKLVCGSAPTLSPFVVAGGSTPTAVDGNVAGRILDGNGRPVAGVTVRMNGTQNRLTVSDGNGNYRFDQVETNGFYTIVPARANYAFSPAQRSFSQLGLHTDAAFIAASTGGGQNPLDTDEYFVRQHYLDFLNREPDEPGLTYWVEKIKVCGGDVICREVARTETSAAFFLSIEFQRTGFEVYRLYRTAFGNLPNAPVPIRLSDFKADARKIGEGVIVNHPGWDQLLEENQQSFALEFVQRSRFVAAYPNSLTPDQFVDQLFANAGVAPLLTERAAVIAEFGPVFNTGDVAARVRALRRVAESSVLRNQEFNRAFVLMQYFGYLGRDPNASPDTNFDGYTFWLSKLESFGGNYQRAEMVKAFVGSAEYRGRFQE